MSDEKGCSHACVFQLFNVHVIDFVVMGSMYS